MAAPGYCSQQHDTRDRSRHYLGGRLLYRAFWLFVYSIVKVFTWFSV